MGEILISPVPFSPTYRGSTVVELFPIYALRTISVFPFVYRLLESSYSHFILLTVLRHIVLRLWRMGVFFGSVIILVVVQTGEMSNG